MTEEYCKNAIQTQIYQEYFCNAKICNCDNHSKTIFDPEGEGNLPLCLSLGIEKEISYEEKISREKDLVQKIEKLLDNYKIPRIKIVKEDAIIAKADEK